MFLPAIFWLMLSFYLLTMPGDTVPKINWMDKLQGDKLVHIAMFAILVMLVLFPIQYGSKVSLSTKTALMVALCALAYGIAMEFVQEYFVSNRSFDLLDMVADGIGSFSGIACWKYLSKKRTAAS